MECVAKFEQFCRLAITCPYDDETLKSLFLIRANYHHLPILQDTSGLDQTSALPEALSLAVPLGLHPWSVVTLLPSLTFSGPLSHWFRLSPRAFQLQLRPVASPRSPVPAMPLCKNIWFRDYIYLLFYVFFTHHISYFISSTSLTLLIKKKKKNTLTLKIIIIITINQTKFLVNSFISLIIIVL